MRKSRFTESQIVGILKQGEEAGVPIAEILSQPNISKATSGTRALTPRRRTRTSAWRSSSIRTRVLGYDHPFATLLACTWMRRGRAPTRTRIAIRGASGRSS